MCSVQKTLEKFETTVADHVHFEEELLTKNCELSEAIGALQKEIVTLPPSALALFSTVDHNDKLVNFYFQTREGNKTYSPAISVILFFTWQSVATSKDCDHHQNSIKMLFALSRFETVKIAQ